LPTRSIQLIVSLMLVASVLFTGQAFAATDTATTTLVEVTYTVVATATLSITSTVYNISVVGGSVSVEKVVSQFDVTSLVAAMFATVAASILGAGVGAYIQSRRQGSVLAYGNRIYCRKHGVPVTITPAGIYCPSHGKIIV
jgi:hypothetical protein